MTDDELQDAEDMLAAAIAGEYGPEARAAVAIVAKRARGMFLAAACEAIREVIGPQDEPDESAPEPIVEPMAPAPKPKAEVFRPPSDDIEMDDVKLMEKARAGEYGPRLARAIEIGGISTQQVRFTVEQMTRPGRSQAEMPTEES